MIWSGALWGCMGIEVDLAEVGLGWVGFVFFFVIFYDSCLV